MHEGKATPTRAEVPSRRATSRGRAAGHAGTTAHGSAEPADSSIDSAGNARAHLVLINSDEGVGEA